MLPEAAAPMNLPIFRSAVVKLTARCDLDCSYCYMFNQKDRTFERVPSRLDIDDAILLLKRIEEHSRIDRFSRFDLALHGGEPTLWPLRFFAQFFETVEKIRQGGLNIALGLQTNAYKMRPDLLRLLEQHRVPLSVSVDGPKQFNDARRITKSRAGSYDRVFRNLCAIADGPQAKLLSAVLCVGNPEIPPEEFIDWIDRLPVRRVDILWPMEFNYRNLPWSGKTFAAYCEHPSYGEWFSELFKIWWKRDDPSLVIRIFFESILVILGSREHTDMIVNDRIDMLVINTDGGAEYHDFMRSYKDGGVRTPYNIRTHSFDEIARDEVFQYLYDLGKHLPHECRECSVASVCGGGFLPGRMDDTSRFPVRRSVLCPDQFRFFRTVYETMTGHVPSLDETNEYRVAIELPPQVEKLNSIQPLNSTQ
jgi:uncharacterized protein